jgi:uncharacterized coiled-coil protein SlyX
VEDRINELEQRYMYQEKTIQELNDIVCRQDLAIEQLRREIVALKEQAVMMNPSVTRDPDQEDPPPHY